MPVINITGALSPHVDDTVTLNGRLDPTNSSWMKIQDCAMVLEEQPGKLAEAFRLFLQGEGYASPLIATPALRWLRSRTGSGASNNNDLFSDAYNGNVAATVNGNAKEIRITENPFVTC